jgi:hypothetical protein
MVEDRRTLGPSESIEEAERLFIEDFDTWDMTGYYLYSKLLRSGVSAHIGTWGCTVLPAAITGASGGSMAGPSCDCLHDRA